MAGLVAFGGHGGRTVAGRTSVPPSPVVTPDTPTPTPRRTARRRRPAAAKASAPSRRRTVRSAAHHSGAGQADPCAHNHHCSVPPLPPLKPEPDPPAPGPTVTVTGAPAG